MSLMIIVKQQSGLLFCSSIIQYPVIVLSQPEESFQTSSTDCNSFLTYLVLYNTLIFIYKISRSSVFSFLTFS
nr:MAG TPA: hypothetical protein [Caudoviricetes sp.]